MKDPTNGLALSSPSSTAPVTTTAAMSSPSSRWNTKNLASRVFADITSAACAGVLVAPLISIIDRSIMENASGAATLSASIRSSFRNLLLSPRSMLISKPCALIFCLYGGTYLTANTIDTATSTIRHKSATHTTSGGMKFAASSATNISVCIYKDQVFVRMFGPPGVVPRPVPLQSYALFAIRDCMTIFSSFNVPPLLAPYIDSKMSDELRRRVSGLSTAQFFAPAAVQLLSTPLHLLGLDLYNRPSQGAAGGTAASRGIVSWADRWQLIRSNWAISVAARICRIVPAYGVGGVVNTKVRRNLMEKLE